MEERPPNAGPPAEGRLGLARTAENGADAAERMREGDYEPDGSSSM